MLSVNFNTVSVCGFELFIDILPGITTKLLLNEFLVWTVGKTAIFVYLKYKIMKERFRYEILHANSFIV